MSRIAIGAAGLLTFVAVYVGLQLVAMRQQQLAQRPPPPTPVVATGLAQRLDTGLVAVALPIGTSEPLVRGLQPGARLNVLASLPEADSGRPVAAVVTRGARLVQPVKSDAPLLVEVAPTDAVVLAHLVLGGTQLNYAVWPEDKAPPEVPPVDERTARALLGLAPRATPTPEPTVAPPATSTPVPSPTAVPTPIPRPNSADRYVVQPGDTLASIAEQLGIQPSRMHAANPSVSESEPLPPGKQLVVPQDN